MARPAKKTRKKPPGAEPETGYKFWKDLSVFGCIISGILLGVVVLALMNPESGIPKVQDVLRIQHQLESEIQQLQVENEKLLHDIEAMKTDPFWKEKIAREELNMALPGEIIYKFPE